MAVRKSTDHAQNEPPATQRALLLAASFDPEQTADMPLTAVIQRWFDEVWCKGNLKAVSQFLTPETEISGAVSALAEPETEYAEVVAAVRNLLGPIKVTITHAMETEDWVSARLIASTSNPEDGTPFEMSGQVMARIENGKFAEMHSNMDYFHMFEMLGQLPPDAMAICMTGERLK
jgi:ketosteroid isomerase-like protein